MISCYPVIREDRRNGKTLIFDDSHFSGSYSPECLRRNREPGPVYKCSDDSSRTDHSTDRSTDCSPSCCNHDSYGDSCREVRDHFDGCQRHDVVLLHTRYRHHCSLYRWLCDELASGPIYRHWYSDWSDNVNGHISSIIEPQW